MMGIEHERIHLETSSVLIRQLPVSMVSRPQKWKYAPATHGNYKTTFILVQDFVFLSISEEIFPKCTLYRNYSCLSPWINFWICYWKLLLFCILGAGAGKNTMIRVASSEVTIGKPYDFPSYGWDNEYGEWTTK